MKTLNRILAGLLMSSMILPSCKEDVVEELPTGTIRVESHEVTLPDAGICNTDIVYLAENTQPYVNIDPVSANWLDAILNDLSITITATLNETGIERTGKVYLKGDNAETVVIIVKQPGTFSPDRTYVYGEKTPDAKGLVYWVDPADAHHAMAVSLEKATSLMWSSNIDALAGAGSYVNGAANCSTLLADTDAQNKYPAAFYCNGLGDGWHLPSRDEFAALFDIYNGVAHNAEGFVPATPDQLTPAETEARNAFENLLKTAGASAFNAAAADAAGDAYWTSTEEDEGGAYYVNVGKFAYSYTGVKKNSTSRFVRCIKVFGDHQYPGEPAVMSVSASEVLLERTASDTVVTATVKNGTLSARVDAASSSWCSVTVDGGNIKIQASENPTTDLREAVVTVTATAAAADGESCSATIAITQKPNIPPYKLYELYYENDKVNGVVFWVSADGMSAKVVSLTRLEPGKFSTASPTAQLVEAPDSENGAANYAIIKASAEASAIPGIAFIEGLGSGWYWPSVKELQQLCAAYHGKDSYGQTTDAYPNALPSDEREAQIAFDKLLTDNGGVAINTQADSAAGDSYWSSTEKSDTNINYVRFGKRSNANGSKGSTRCVRGIKLISKL